MYAQQNKIENQQSNMHNGIISFYFELLCQFHLNNLFKMIENDSDLLKAEKNSHGNCFFFVCNFLTTA
jgi:hypothetical protein